MAEKKAKILKKSAKTKAKDVPREVGAAYQKRNQPCIAALRRIEEALGESAKSRLGHELDLMHKAVADCPLDCGCKNSDRLCVVFSGNADFLGELSTTAGRFRDMRLSMLGEEVLGQHVQTWQMLGLPLPAAEQTVRLRDGGFLDAFLAWCGQSGYRPVELLEPQVRFWTELQCRPLKDEERLSAIERIACLTFEEAEDLLSGL